MELSHPAYLRSGSGSAGAGSAEAGSAEAVALLEEAVAGSGLL